MTLVWTAESEDDSDEEYETDDDEEYETDDDEDEEEEEEEEEVKPKKKAKKGRGGKRSKPKRTNSSRSVSSGAGSLQRKTSIDSDVEKRIEEKIMKRLKKQEEQRIAVAIEQRMKAEKANWRDDEMNRIIMEMRERFQSEMSNSSFFATLAKKNGLAVDSQEMQALQQSMEQSFMSNPQAEDKLAAGENGEGIIGPDGMIIARTRSVSKESSWNNACRAFEALRVVVWKHSFLPRIKFDRDDSGIWNRVTEVDADESFAHITVGDKLLSVNGRAIDDAIQTEEDINDVFAAYASPLIMKFEAIDPDNNKVHDYTLTWTNGPLGVTLKDDCTTQKIPIVNRLTKKAGSVAVKQNIAIGDVLVAINNIDTIQLGCSLSMSILKKVQLPAKLRFRGVGGPPPGSDTAASSSANESDAVKPVGSSMGSRTPSMNNFSMSMSRPSTYTINWAEGPLGLTIIPGLNDGDMPVIKKVTGTGTSAGIEKAQIGDFLESMNDQNAASMHFEDVVAYLKTTPKPVLLRFRASLDDDMASLPSSSPAPSSVLAASSSKAINFKTMSSTASRPESQISRSSYESTLSISSNADSAPAGVQVVRDDRQDVYRVVWGSGPLGLTIDANTGGPGAFIKRISSQGAAAQLSQDCIGDDLTHINEMDVTRVMFQDIVGHLKNVPRPVTLFFHHRNSGSRRGSFASTSSRTSEPSSRRQDSGGVQSAPVPSSPSVHYYNVVWQDGMGLGLSLRGADGTSEYPYITRVTGTGSAANLPQTVINDCLISIDGRSVHVRDKAFDEVMTMLKVMQKPVTLKFQSRGLGGAPIPTGPPPNQYGSSPTMHRPGSASNMYAPSPPPPSPMQYQAPPPQAPMHYQAPPQALAAPPPPPAPRQPLKQQESHTWRHNRAAAAPVSQLSQSYSGMPAPSSLAHQGSSAALSRSYAGGASGQSDRGLEAGGDDKFSSIQAPFLAQNKLSTGRRQKMLKGLKK